MGILKLTPEELKDISYSRKELSLFWQSYFSGLSVDFAKLFFKYSRETISVRYLHRDVVNGKEYLEAICDNSVIRPFELTPNHGMGFLFLTDELSNYFINSILGGRIVPSEIQGHFSQPFYPRSKMTEIDNKLLENILDDMLKLLLNRLKESHREIEFRAIDPREVLFLKRSESPGPVISVQQFLVVNSTQSFVFDIAFSSRALENFVLL